MTHPFNGSDALRRIRVGRPTRLWRALKLAVTTSLLGLACFAVGGCGPDAGNSSTSSGSGAGDTGGGSTVSSTGGAGGGTTSSSSSTGGGGTGGESTSSSGTTSFTVPEGCSIVFDPAKVYMLGTLEEGAGYLDAVALPEDPTQFCVGFEKTSTPILRPTDQALLYFGGPTFVDQEEIRVFTPEALAWDAAEGIWKYPEGAASNDPVVPTPKCSGSPSLTSFTVNAENGKVVYRCWSDLLTYTEDGTPVTVPDSGYLVDYGYGDHKLAVGSFYDLILLDPQGVEVPIPAIPWPDYELVAARARPDGFWVVTSDNNNALARWHVDFTGAAVNEGAYAPSPPMLALFFDGKLDGSGNLVLMGTHTDVAFQDVIVRLPLSPAASEVIYDEGNAPPDGPSWSSEMNPGFYPKLHISHLFTGP